MTTQKLKNVPKEEWDQKTVGDLAVDCGDETTVSVGTDAVKALSMMNRSGNSRLLVVDNDRLVGVLALKDLMRFLSVKLDLEGYESAIKA